MKYLFDSNIISDIYNISSLNHPLLINRLLRLKEDDAIFISILTLYEFEYALVNAPDYKKVEIDDTILQIQQDFVVLPLVAVEAKIFANLKRHIKALRNISPANLPKHNIDLMIAASALNQQAVLVSADKIFQDISLLMPELKLENWTMPS